MNYSRSYRFAANAVRKLARGTLACAIPCVGYGLIRRNIPQPYRDGLDFAWFIFAIVYLLIFCCKLTRAWIKSGETDKYVLPHGMSYGAINMAAIISFAAFQFVVVYALISKWVYFGLEKRGQFGDSFGALNSLISTGMFVGVCITLWLQYRQLEEDRVARLQEIKERHRAHWPIVETTQLKGTINIQNIDQATNMVIYQMQVSLCSKNLSKIVLLNLVNNLKAETLSNPESFIDINSQVIPFAKQDGDITSAIMLVSSVPVSQAIPMSLIKKGLVFKHSTYYATPQQFYFVMEQEYKVRVELSEKNRKILEAWISTFAKLGDKISFERFRAMLLKDTQIAVESSIELAFETIPNPFSISELAKDEYLDAISRGKHFIYKG